MTDLKSLKDALMQELLSSENDKKQENSARSAEDLSPGGTSNTEFQEIQNDGQRPSSDAKESRPLAGADNEIDGYDIDASIRRPLADSSKGPTSSDADNAEYVSYTFSPKRNNPYERAKSIRANKLSVDEVNEKKQKRRRRYRSNGITSFKPLWSGDQLRLKLQQYDRTPFIDLLAMWMECTPNPQTIMAFADKHPDRFINAMNSLGRLGGFAEKKEVDINLSAQVSRMSDSQVEDRFRDAAYKLGIPVPKLIDTKALNIDEMIVTSDDEQK